MPTITPTVTYEAGNYRQVKWEGIANGDTIVAFQVPGTEGAIASVQITGTFGAAVALGASDDGTNFPTVSDQNTNDISATADARFEFSTAALYIKPTEAGVTDVDVTVTLRG